MVLPLCHAGRSMRSLHTSARALGIAVEVPGVKQARVEDVMYVNPPTHPIPLPFPPPPTTTPHDHHLPRRMEGGWLLRFALTQLCPADVFPGVSGLRVRYDASFATDPFFGVACLSLHPPHTHPPPVPPRRLVQCEGDVCEPHRPAHHAPRSCRAVPTGRLQAV
jgi:hypothetical protein